MKLFFQAIADNSLAEVKRLIRANRKLSCAQAEEDRLFTGDFVHWLYVGDTPLHLAAAGYRVEIARLLLASGADPNAAHNRRRSTPLHYASDGCVTLEHWDEKVQVRMLKLLIGAGANVAAADKNGATALHRAVRTRCAKAVRFLLEVGANPTARNLSGQTPFHLAVQNTGKGGSGESKAISGQKEIIEAFLSAGLDPDLRNGDGVSVCDSAQSHWVKALLHQ